jgi:hypothetical protein
MTANGKPASNDGGQTYRKEPRRLWDIVEGGHAHLDGITRYQDTKEYTYASGDATKAYDADHVRLAQRDIVYLRATSRPHPVIVIFDRVESTKPEYDKRFIIHTVNKPVIDGKMTIAENKGGRLTCLTLLPENPRLQLIGGPGKEFWVNGENFPIDSKRQKYPSFIEPGEWRLEVSPLRKQTMDYFIHVLFVDDAEAALPDQNSAKLNKTDRNAEVLVAGWKITFPFAAGSAALVERAQ